MSVRNLLIFLFFFTVNLDAFAAVNKSTNKKQSLSGSSLFFDFPVTYNKRVSYWINHFQTSGKTWFREWLERANVFMPMITSELQSSGLPRDLGYMVMIESGFSPTAVSVSAAVGPWQFIQSTGTRYGLKKNWWLDERRDLRKSTLAATRYIRDLYREFGSWYLVAASYNMGENGLRRQIKKFRTKDYWELSRRGALPQETVDYVPKIIAAMMISKAPGLYGFRDLTKMKPLEYEVVSAPGGVNLDTLAGHIGVTSQALKDLNAELHLGYIPPNVDKHLLRLPKGSLTIATQYFDHVAKK